MSGRFLHFKGIRPLGSLTAHQEISAARWKVPTNRKKARMAVPTIAAYGTWKSEITMDMMLQQSVHLSQVQYDADDLYYIERRPDEGGRSVLMRRSPRQETAEVLPCGFNVRTRVHEYGGRAYLVWNRKVWFSNFRDQRIWCLDPDAEAPRPLTAEGDLRYAELTMDATRDRLIAVREDHRDPSVPPCNAIVGLAADGEQYGRVLVSGDDFYSNPRVSPDGERLCWLAWNHPDMPWDGTALWVGHLNAAGLVERAEVVAGGPNESVFQPEWSPDGILTFVSDRSNWWNLYQLRHGHAVNLAPRSAEFGEPLWQLGTRTYGYVDADRLLCRYRERDGWHLGLINLQSGEMTQLLPDYAEFGDLAISGPRAVVVAGNWQMAPRLVAVGVDDGTHVVVKRAQPLRLRGESLAKPQSVIFPTTSGEPGYAYFYAPTNPNYRAPGAEKPPLLVMVHGGPTGNSETGLDLGIQYWTSRGFAILDVNYGGSTGYGREYRNRLRGTWGVVDVDDTVSAATFVAEAGLVDPARMAIRGSSAGGYTVLCGLAFRKVFTAGASYYGVADLEGLAADTHKFESHYTDRLIGTLPQARDRYRQRSPFRHPEGITVPVIFFQGLDDRVVPPNQAERMVEALRRQGVAVAYLTFEGEGHGFRNASTIRQTNEAELYFYGRVFGFEPSDNLTPIPIENF